MLTPDQFPDAVRAVLGDITRITYPPQGMTSEVVLVDCEHGRRAIKRVADDARYKAWLVLEANVLLALAEVNLPIPHCYFPAFLLNDRAVWLVMDAFPGEPLGIRLEALDDPAQRSAYAHDFGALVRRIHDTPAPPSLVKRYGDRGWLDRKLAAAGMYLRYPSHFPTDGGTPELLEQLDQQRPAPVQPCLIHGDMTADNVLVEDGRITGVIDWAGGAYGDPRYDLALALDSLGDQPDGAALQAAFRAGYGAAAMPTPAESRYWLDLYEFF